ncbi:anti-sigma factor [Streptomyces profundus]|uniref:anti-sigma factor n=1 Tax=Streptomyces profundus TaxID=2867410 RepID=UPI001D169452|nr:anti-sigma factor [Streptomyces sp. MA3_2.13]UED87232.1 anti-sigma factor [Streptomyces sp. MA3_2.13]
MSERYEAESHTLSGAYALNAVSDEERARFERHLRRCEACAHEVAELAETAGRLGVAAARVPPRAMRETVLRRIGSVRQEPPAGLVRRLTPRMSRFALAACLAAAVLAGTTVWQWQEAERAREGVERAERHADALTRVLAAPDARITTGELPGGGTATVVLSPGHDQAAFLASGLPEPPADRVYQLWFDDAGTMRPAGLLDPAAGDSALLMDGRVDGAGGMGITVEPSGGSPQPTTEPLATMAFAG